MGYQDSNYKGFYILVTPNNKDAVYQETRCTNSECENNKKEVSEKFKFCPICGSKIDWIDFTEQEPNSFNDNSDDIVSDVHLYDWFYSPHYVNEMIDEDWNEINLSKEEFETSEVIICNRNFGAKLPTDRDIFTNHPATKLLLEKMNCKYEIKYGLVAYSA